MTSTAPTAFPPLHALIIEHEQHDVELMLRELRRAGYDVRHRIVDTPETLRTALQEREWDVILCDYNLPRFSAPEALRLLRGVNDSTPFLVVTGSISEEVAVDCLKSGADNYVLKHNLARLAPSVRQALQMLEDRRKRRLLEQRLEHSQKMEALGRVAAGVAHDFNNLLTVILSCGESLRQHARGDDDQDAVSGLMEAARQASDLTRQLLTVARKQPAAPQEVELNELVREMQPMIARLVGPLIQVDMSLSAGPLPVRLDVGQIRLGLMNLSANARDAMPRGGLLRVRTRRASASDDFEMYAPGLDPARCALLEVQDSGTGMSAETLHRLFEPFFSTKEQSKGTGLGLAMTHGLVNQAGGAIWAESSPGVGSTFRILLPLQDEAAVPSAEVRRAARIVLAEDEPMIRKLAETALRRAGFDVLSAGSGGEALARLRESGGSVRLVITDDSMPQMSGIELATAVRDEFPRVPVLLISGSALPASQTAHLIAGFLGKPFLPRELVEKVRVMTESAA